MKRINKENRNFIKRIIKSYNHLRYKYKVIFKISVYNTFTVIEIRYYASLKLNYYSLFQILTIDNETNSITSIV